MELKHTKTPWTLETVKTSCGICHKIGPFPPKPGSTRLNHACVYADYPGNGPHDAELLANARLIAAAPDLLASLLAMIERMKFYSDDLEDDDTYQRACKVFAKATGTEP